MQCVSKSERVKERKKKTEEEKTADSKNVRSTRNYIYFLFFFKQQKLNSNIAQND